MTRPMLQIGDVLPLPRDFDPEAARYAIARRGQTARVAGRKAVNQRTNAARKILAAIEQERARSNDPTQQAATFLRRKGFTVFRADVLEGARKGWIVGRRTIATDKDLRAYAQERGWTPH